jgi:hypothetical protein
MACAVGLLLICSLLASSPSRPSTSVDLELVLASDASLSMNRPGRQLERAGYARAFRDGDVVAAIGSGAQRRIAVTLIEWSGQAEQTIVVPWTIVGDKASAEAFSEAIEAAPLLPRRHGLTAVGNALLFGARQILLNDIGSARRVIDISGNGAENDGLPAEKARSAILGQGITINGLPVGFERTGPGLASMEHHGPSIESFYRDHVVGGAGSFIMSVTTGDDFAEAIRRKLVREISGHDGVRKMAKDMASPLWRRARLRA